jgi:hypothetical protein
VLVAYNNGIHRGLEYRPISALAFLQLLFCGATPPAPAPKPCDEECGEPETEYETGGGTRQMQVGCDLGREMRHTVPSARPLHSIARRIQRLLVDAHCKEARILQRHGDTGSPGLMIASLPQRTSVSRQKLCQNSIKKDLSFKIAQAFYELRKIILSDQFSKFRGLSVQSGI